MKIGFFHNTHGGHSHLKLVNAISTVCVLGVWVYLCIKKEEFLTLDPMVLTALGGGQLVNTANKWVELASKSSQK